jgi:acyl-CoA reductase-like NAD-dependent aldehyde dehydrogenase
MSSRILQRKVIKNIFFAGTTDHGKEITKLLGTDLHTKLNLQLSTKNCCIIDNHNDLNSFVPALIKSAFQATGQFSTRTALVFAHNNIIDQLIEQTHAIAKKIIIDHPFAKDHTPFMGPLISQTNLDNYLQYMGMALREGGIEIMRGKRLEDLNGYYVTPSIHKFEISATLGHFLKSEQLFPNLTFISYDNLEDVINKINQLPFGLACSVFLKNESDIKKCIQQLPIGILLKHSFLDHHSRHYRFGGDKDSSNFANVGTAMFEAGLKRVTIRHAKEKLPDKLYGIATKDLK